MDLSRSDRVGESLDRGLHCIRVRGATRGPAVMRLVPEAEHEARVGRIVEITPRLRGLVRDLDRVRIARRVLTRDAAFGEERLLLDGPAGRVAVRGGTRGHTVNPGP